MGHSTRYTLVVGEGGYEVSDDHREEILDWLEGDERFRCELEDSHEGGMTGFATWREHDRDMLRLSRAFPGTLFVLWGEGEGVEDLWKCYYVGGRMQEAPARVEYAPFDPENLERSEPHSSRVGMWQQ